MMTLYLMLLLTLWTLGIALAVPVLTVFTQPDYEA